MQCSLTLWQQELRIRPVLWHLQALVTNLPLQLYFTITYPPTINITLCNSRYIILFSLVQQSYVYFNYINCIFIFLPKKEHVGSILLKDYILVSKCVLTTSFVDINNNTGYILSIYFFGQNRPYQYGQCLLSWVLHPPLLLSLALPKLASFDYHAHVFSISHVLDFPICAQFYWINFSEHPLNLP